MTQNADDMTKFWSRVDQSGGPDACWPWTRGRDRDGYGRLVWRGTRGSGGHRVSWEITNGGIPAGLHVLHRCDNPPCCNPAHLFLGTNADNMRDRDAKGRGGLSGDRHWSRRHPEKKLLGDRNPARTRPERLPRGEKHGRARLTADDVRAIRAEYSMRRGETYGIAARYGMSHGAIYAIVHRMTWRHI